jgi:hypothetical protein
MIKTKSERREQLARKLKLKTKKGGTFSGQILHLQTRKNLAGTAKKMKK